MRAIISDKWILCPECGAKTRTQILEDTELKHFPLFCPKCKKNFIIDVKNRIVDYQTDADAKTQSTLNSCPASFLAKNEDKVAVIQKYS